MAQGTIYLFVKSKEDLFQLALAYAMEWSLEEATQKSMGLVELRQQFIPGNASVSLATFIANPDHPVPALDAVLSEYWDSVSKAARAIKLIERCAVDWPELARFFYEEVRTTIVGNLATYLVAGAKAGICRRVIDPYMSARFIVESIAWFTIHRLGDHDARAFDSAKCKATVIDNLIHTFRLTSESHE